MRQLDVTKLLGNPEPRIYNYPPGIDCAEADDTLELSRLAGMSLLPWESAALKASMRRRDGFWAAQTVGIVAARRNGKTSIVHARNLGGAIIFKVPYIAYTAHRDETSLDAMNDMLQMLQSHRDLERTIQKVITRNGHHGIRFKGGTLMRFKTRVADGGRGLDGNIVVLDEAFKIYEATIAAMLPTLAAVEDPQLWMLSSAVDKLKHPYAESLTRLRRRAIRAMETGVPDESLLYLEYSAEPGPDPDNPLKDMPLPPDHPTNLYNANPSLGEGPRSLINLRYVANEKKDMGQREWLVERLSLGFWPKEPLSMLAEAPAVISEPDLRRHVVTSVVIPEKAPCVLAVDMDKSRKWVSVAAGTQLGNRAIHLEIGRHEAPTRVLTRYIISLAFRWNISALVIDGQSGARSLIPEFEKAGLEVEVTTASQLAMAFGGLHDDIIHGGPETLSFYDDQLIFDSVAGSVRRDLAGGWAIDRRGEVDVSPFVAIALARFGLLNYAEVEVPSQVPVVISSQPNGKPSGTDPLASAFGTPVQTPIYRGQPMHDDSISTMQF